MINDSFLQIIPMNEWMMYFYSAISMFAHGTLQQFVGDFGQTTLSSLQFFFEGDLADAPNTRNYVPYSLR